MKPALKTLLPRLIPALAWTLLVSYLMLSPGKSSVADDISTAFGGTDWSDAAGHVLMCFIESLLLFALLRLYFAPRTALIASALTTVILGGLEIAQIWVPYRGATLFDFASDAVGAGLFILALAAMWRMARAGRTLSTD